MYDIFKPTGVPNTNQWTYCITFGLPFSLHISIISLMTSRIMSVFFIDGEKE